jgi:hypothetical protein
VGRRPAPTTVNDQPRTSLHEGTEDRRAARAARTSPEHDLASYTSSGDLNDLDAILDRHSEEETADRHPPHPRRAALPDGTAAIRSLLA